MKAGIVKVGALALVLCGTRALGVAGAGAAVGCGGDSASGVAAAKLPAGVRSEVIEHEACDESGNKVELLDANNDGKPDIRKVSKGGREVCRITDLNHDGKPDMFEYFDPTGQLRRREADYDDNGVVNSIEYFENGKLARRELDTTNQGKIDTWDFFDATTGARSKRERDSNGDGKVDQWWVYEAGGQVTIAMDQNGDGQPDPDSTMTLGANGQVITPTDAGASAALTDAAAAPSAPSAPPAPSAPAPPTLSMPSPNDGPSTAPTTDAGVAGKPARGGAKR